MRNPMALQGGCAVDGGDTLRLAYTVLLMDQARAVLRAFSAAGVPVLVLKGLAYLSSFQPMEAGRRTSDIDLLIHPEDLERAGEVLLRAGFHEELPWPADKIPFIEEHPRQAVYARPISETQIAVDLHWELLNLDPRPLGFAIEYAQLWDSSVPLLLDGQPERRLCDVDLVVHSCLHHTIHDGGGSTQDLHDIACVVAAPRFDWTSLVARARGWGVGVPVWWALRRARTQAGAPVPDHVLSALRPHILFRLCLPAIERRARRPLADRLFRGENHIVTHLQAPTAARALAGLLRLAWPSDGWLATHFAVSQRASMRRLWHLSLVPRYVARKCLRSLTRPVQAGV